MSLVFIHDCTRLHSVTYIIHESKSCWCLFDFDYNFSNRENIDGQLDFPFLNFAQSQCQDFRAEFCWPEFWSAIKYMTSPMMVKAVMSRLWSTFINGGRWSNIKKTVLQFTVYLLLSKVHFTDLFEGQHYLKKIYIN